MRSSKRLSWIGSALALITLAACTAAPEDGDQESTAAAQTAGAKTVARGLAFPSHLIATRGGFLWTESRVRPTEPGQAFTFASRVVTLASSSSSPTTVEELATEIEDILVDGDDVFVVQAGKIEKTTLAGLAGGDARTKIYDDRAHFDPTAQPVQGMPDGVASAVVSGGRVYMLRTTGELVSVAADGRDYTLHARGEGAAFGLVVKDGIAAFTTGRMGNTMSRQVSRLDVRRPGAPIEVVAEESYAYEWRGAALVLDGDDVVYGTRTGVKRFSLASGTASAIVTGFSSVRNARFDGDTLLVLGKKGDGEGLFSVPRSAVGENAPVRQVMPLADGGILHALPDGVYVTTNGVRMADARAGTIAEYLGTILRLDRSALR